jgi:valyl-tRNA synthetase
MFGNLGEHAFTAVPAEKLAPEDRWILSRLSRIVRSVTDELEAYNPSAAVGAARDFFWGELCDWYLEIIKPRLRDEAQAPIARSVLALAFDQVLRLFHPFVPFITEVLWERLNAQCPVRGITSPQTAPSLIITAAWPQPQPRWEDEAVEADFAVAVGVVRAVRDMRARHGLSPAQKLAATVKAAGGEAEALVRLKTLVVHMGNLESLTVAADAARPALSVVQVVGGMEIYVPGLIDPAKERARLEAQRAKLAEMRAQVESLEAGLKALG